MNYSLLCHWDTLLNNHTVVHFQKIQINRKILVSFYVARDLGWKKKKKIKLILLLSDTSASVVKSGKLQCSS